MDKMSVSVYMNGGYEEFYTLKATKKQSQTKPNKLNFTAENAEFAELLNINHSL
jgi:hypothetical protein